MRTASNNAARDTLRLINRGQLPQYNLSPSSPLLQAMLSVSTVGLRSNAQAGLRFLARGNSDIEEVRGILEDIVRDDKRAAAVISGLRAMVRRPGVVRRRAG